MVSRYTFMVVSGFKEYKVFIIFGFGLGLSLWVYDSFEGGSFLFRGCIGVVVVVGFS